MKKKIIAGVFAGALSVGGVAAQENSTNHLEAANGNVSATNGQSLQSQDNFAKDVLAQILARSGDAATERQNNTIKAFCDAFNEQVVEPLKSISQDIDIKAEYKEDVITLHSGALHSDDACVITVNGEKIDTYSYLDILLDEYSKVMPGGIRAPLKASEIASRALDALDGIQLRIVARRAGNLLADMQAEPADAPEVPGI